MPLELELESAMMDCHRHVFIPRGCSHSSIMIFYDFTMIFRIFTLLLVCCHLTTASSLSKRLDIIDNNPDGSSFLWLLQDDYSGNLFFEYPSRSSYSSHPAHVHPASSTSIQVQIQQSTSFSPSSTLPSHSFSSYSGSVESGLFLLLFPP